jgi:hypothetical protein
VPYLTTCYSNIRGIKRQIVDPVYLSNSATGGALSSVMTSTIGWIFLYLKD